MIRIVIAVTITAFMIEIDFLKNDMDLYCFELSIWRFNVVLLGPQIKYMQNNLSSKASVYGIKVQPIEMLDYGMLRGDRVLDIALELAK